MMETLSYIEFMVFASRSSPEAVGAT